MTDPQPTLVEGGRGRPTGAVEGSNPAPRPRRSVPQAASHGSGKRKPGSLVTRLSLAILGVVVLAGAGLIGLSVAGVLSDAKPLALNAAYVEPDPTPVAPPPLDVMVSPASPSVGEVSSALASVSASHTGRAALLVRDTQGGALANSGGALGMIPASNMKIITAIAALDTFDADHRFTTTVQSTTDGIVLVGAGDPSLSLQTPAGTGGSLQGLAAATAQALVAQGVTSVTLGYDISLFSGPPWHPSWPGIYLSDISPVTALCADIGWSGSSPVPDCPSWTAQQFSSLLTQQGISVSRISPGQATGEVIASVDSLPMGALVQGMLTYSDNQWAETLFRLIAIARGQPATFAGGSAAVQDCLTSLGLWSPALVIADGSGLSRDSRLTPAVLTQALSLALTTPEFADLVDGLPVAGVTGTLMSRFDDTVDVPGRGVVRAKTGTLDGVRTLSGYVQTTSGRVAVFSFMVNDAANGYAAVDWLDHAASALAQL